MVYLKHLKKVNECAEGLSFSKYFLMQHVYVHLPVSPERLCVFDALDVVSAGRRKKRDEVYQKES